MYDRDCRRVVVGAGEGGFDLGLYYADPGGTARRVRGTAGGCADCEWQVTAACDQNRPVLPGESGGAEVNCGRAARTCPAGVFQQVWLRRAGVPWRPIDTVCVPIASRVSNLRDLGPDVAEAFRRMPLPVPRLRLQPATRAVIGIPSIFYAGPEQEQHVSLSVTGFAVRLSAAAETWTWDFDDGDAPAVTDVPGAPYPDQTIVHTYRRTAVVRPAVTCTWAASYVVDGVDLVVPVDAQVSRTSTASLAVREARAELVGGS